jgi:DNA-binding transcriptional LysR family regulator
MPKLSQRGAANSQQPAPRPRKNALRWDDLRVLLACANTGTFRGAARDLGIDSATVARRIERLERDLGTRLFHRVPEGIVITQDGRLILDGARNMEKALCDLGRKRTLAEQTARTSVTIAVTEGLGSYWVMPKLVEFQREHANVTVNLSCAMASVDVLRLEADIAIQFTRPTSPDLIVCKLGRLHLYPFASEDYLETYGHPHSAADFVNHRFVQQIAPQLDETAFAAYFGIDTKDLVVGVRTNASTAHLYAVEKGAGIGVLPNYAAALGAPVVPVDIGKRYSLDIWMTYHPDIKLDRTKAQMISWLRDIFDPDTYPWFADAFTHPDKIKTSIPKTAAINFGHGFASANPMVQRILFERKSKV